MVQASALYTTFLAAVLAAGSPVTPRAVDKLSDTTFKEAQQRDDAATRALANVQRGTSRATIEPPNTTKPSGPVDTITRLPLRSLAPGAQQCSLNVVTVVNTVTVTMPPPSGRESATNILYSTISPTETSAPGKKASSKKNNSGCNDNDSDSGVNNSDSKNDGGRNKSSASATTGRDTTATTRGNNIGGCNQGSVSATTTRSADSQHTANPTAAADANQFDTTARRALESVNLRAADGRCLIIDPTAGDFRQNLIPVGLATCSEDPEQKFDVVTQGKHNDAKDGKALLVSVLTNGCLNFDSRRQQGDTVTIFSCGGRADGGGQTATSQLFPFNGTNSIVLQPSSDGGKFCLVAGNDRLGSTSCDNQKDQVFELVEVLQSTADKLL